MPSDTLQDAITEFVNRVRTITRQEVLGAMHAVLSGDIAPAPRRGRPARAASAADTASPGRPRKAKGGKRDPQVLEALVARLAAEIKAKPGLRIEHIGKALRVNTKELALPIRKLLKTKKIKKSGTRRATKYFPA